MSKTLYIIDGHALIYSAFYAPMSGDLISPDGEPTKATYVFTSMILKLLKDRHIDMLAVAMDSPGPTFRHKMYDLYKAHRPPMPDELPCQIDRITEILTAMNIPVFRLPGYEADDIIGTVVDAAAAKNYDVFICSKDKDLEQLISEHVVMYDQKRDIQTGPAELLENKGITPQQVIDILALQGDTSDNIPGIPDVGPKTACQWIQKYGTIEQLLTHQDEIKGKRGDNLRANIEQLQLSKQLVTIDRNVPVELDWPSLALKPFDAPALLAIFNKLGFQKLLRQIDPSGTTAQSPSSTIDQTPAVLPPVPVTNVKAQYILLDDESAFDLFLAELKKQKIFALDTETTSINPVAAKLVGLSFAFQAHKAYYLPIRGPLGQKCLDAKAVLEKLKPILTDEKIEKIGQNIKYDTIVLRRAGIDLAGVTFDTMIASYLLDSSRSHHNLDSLALDFLGHETIKIASLIGKGKNQLTFDMVDLGIACDYAAEDADITWRLYEYFNDRLSQPANQELRRLFEQVEMPLTTVLGDMEYQGVALDVPFLNKMSTKLSDRLTQLVDEIHSESGCQFNVDSPKQLAEVLFDKLQLKSVKKTRGGASGVKSKSTDQEVLQALSWQHPVPALMLEYRKLAKLKNTYVDKLPSMICSDTGRVHASFNQSVTATGRLSSSNPNMQNIPIRSEQGQEIRRAFVTGKKTNIMLAADYSQIELRFVAHFSNDKNMIEAFQSGQDIHRFVASQVYNVSAEDVDSAQRSKAKAVNFGIIYGQTAYGLSRSIGIPVEEAQKFIDEYFDRYAQVETFIQNTIAQAHQAGSVRTILGRRRTIANLTSRNHNLRKLAERMAVNTVVQGSAADMIKLAMINLHQRIIKEKLDMKMILQVHDELVFELPDKDAAEYADIITTEMTTAMKLNVPVTVDIGTGKNWLQCK